MIKAGNKKGFTLAELLVAMVVTSIILAAIATLAFAMSSSASSSEDISIKQAQIRFASLRLMELIRRSRLVYSYDSAAGKVVVWDDIDQDNEADDDELITIEVGTGRNYIRIQESGQDPYYLIPECSNVQFVFDSTPPQSRELRVSFSLTEDGNLHQYQIDMVLRSWAGNLLSGSTMVSDDD
jgi:prepilin-type N-terminal cleavage/methylation domain-containing protein